MARGSIGMRATGAKELVDLGARFRAAGQAGMRRQITAGLTRAARATPEALRQSARQTLPGGGGRTPGSGESLADRVAMATVSIASKAGRNPTVGVRVTPRAGHGVDLNQLDEGLAHKPLFGNRRHWYPQRVTPGWFSRAVDSQADNVRDELLQSVEDVKRDIT